MGIDWGVEECTIGGHGDEFQKQPNFVRASLPLRRKA
jgi:hypothetical protein